MNSAEWLLLLGFLEKIVSQCFCHAKFFLLDDAARMNSIREVLDILR